MWYKDLFSGSLYFYGDEIGSGYYFLPKVRGSPRNLLCREKLSDLMHNLPERRCLSQALAANQVVRGGPLDRQSSNDRGNSRGVGFPEHDEGS